MIKLRVEWHHKCPGCGTRLVVDFFDELAGSEVCPWCGCACDISTDVGYREMKRYIEQVVKEVESKANVMLAVGQEPVKK